MSIKIDQAFITSVLNGALAIDVVHENGLYSTWNGSAYVNSQGVYTPDANREHMEIRSFPAGRIPLSLNDSDEAVGFFQAIIKYPADIGAITIKQKAEAFLALFVLGSALTYDTQKVYISSKTRDGGRIEGGFYQIVCRVDYTAYLTRG